MEFARSGIYGKVGLPSRFSWQVLSYWRGLLFSSPHSSMRGLPIGEDVAVVRGSAYLSGKIFSSHSFESFRVASEWAPYELD